MPYINIEVSGQPVSAGQAQRITAAMTRIMAGTARKKGELTSVRVGQNAAAWTIGAVGTVNEPRANMEIHVTRNTNTAEEIAALVHQGYAELTAAFGTLPDATYVIVHEHGEGNWGYAGVTQGARRCETAR